MGSRGRKSVGELFSPGSGAVAVVPRPDPPLELTPEQADVWREVVDALPADWFPRETWGLLAQYCRHVIEARRIAQLIDQECAKERLSISNYNELLKMQERQSARIKVLSASMRLSQQSSYNHKTAATAKNQVAGVVRRPWE